MPPRATARAIRCAPLYDPAPGSVHVLDTHRDSNLHYQRISDMVFGMLWYGLIESVITQTDVCDFRSAFEPHLRIRQGRTHEGHPFLGPDGQAVTIRGIVYNGGDATILPSPLSGVDIQAHPNYQQWLSSLLFRGGDRNNSLHHLAIMNGSLRASGKVSASTVSPAPALDDALTVDTDGHLDSDGGASPISTIRWLTNWWYVVVCRRKGRRSGSPAGPQRG